MWKSTPCYSAAWVMPRFIACLGVIVLTYISIADGALCSARIRKNCTVCPAGKEPAGNECRVCPAGKVKPQAGNKACQLCRKGWFTVGATMKSHDQLSDCLPGGAKRNKGTLGRPEDLLSMLQKYQDQLIASKSFTGKGGGGRNGGCLIGCGTAGPDAASIVGLFIAASPADYRSDVPIFGLPSRLPNVKQQDMCASNVNYALASVAEAAVAALQAVDASTLSYSPVYAYYCDAVYERACSTGWSFEDALARLVQHPWSFFTKGSCVQANQIAAASSQGVAGRPALKAACSSAMQGPACKASASPVQKCSYEALDGFWSIQRAIRRSGAVLTQMMVNGDFTDFLVNNPNGVYQKNVTSADAVPMALVLVGYSNTGFYWWAQSALGGSFGVKGRFKVAFGTGDVGNPATTYALRCQLTDRTPIPARQKMISPDLDNPGCYFYTAQQGEYLADIADQFGVDLVKLTEGNVNRGVIPLMPDNKQPDVSVIAGKILQICGMTEDLLQVAKLVCGPGLYRVGATCEVCPDDMIKTNSSADGSCTRCPDGSVTVGWSRSNHDELSDCKPASDYFLCDGYIGQNASSGVYEITVAGNRYPAYCDMETDGGGWTLIMNYNVKWTSTRKEPFMYSRFLNTEGFPIINTTNIGQEVDEATSTGKGGSWGHLVPSAVARMAKITELRVYRNALVIQDKGTMHFKTANANAIAFFAGSGDSFNLAQLAQAATPLAGHNVDVALLSEDRGWVFAYSQDGYLVWDKWGFSEFEVWIRGSPGRAKDCAAGTYPVGYGCHVCPVLMYKPTADASSCISCPIGSISGSAGLAERRPGAHDSLTDCASAQPSQVIPRPGGGLLEYFADPLPFSDAQDICRGRQGNLMSVTSQDLAKALSSLLAQAGNGSYAWIGLRSGGASTTDTTAYGWVSGVKSTFTNWTPGQPDDAEGKQGAFVVAKGPTGQWDDWWQNGSASYLCESQANGRTAVNGTTCLTVGTQLLWYISQQELGEFGSYLLGQKPAASPDDCCDLCKDTTGCNAWSWVGIQNDGRSNSTADAMPGNCQLLFRVTDCISDANSVSCGQRSPCPDGKACSYGLTIKPEGKQVKSVNVAGSITWKVYDIQLNTQQEVKQFCTKRGGQLITVDSPGKTQLLLSEVLPTTVERSVVWIGLESKGGPTSDVSRYFWQSGAPSGTYSNWGTLRIQGVSSSEHDQPDNAGGKEGICVCAVSKVRYGTGPAGAWDDVACKTLLPYAVCEFVA